jgi:hypothetical protein
MKVERAQVGALAEVLRHASLSSSIVTLGRFGPRDASIQVNEYDPRGWRRKPTRRRTTVIGARGGLTIREEQ